MKQLSSTLFTMNSDEKRKILSVIAKQDKSAYMFYKSLFKYNKIPTFFIDDIIMFLNKSTTHSAILNNLKLINSTSNISKFIEIDQSCYRKLKDFQITSFDKINNLLQQSGYYRGILIGDEPGLGKTITSICIAKSYMKTNNLTFDDLNIIVVVPLTLVSNWIHSMQKEFPNAKISNNPEIDADIYIINYEKLSKITIPNSIVIVDEAHNFHNIASNRYRELFNQAVVSEFIILLTGTPIRDGILNLLALYALIDYKLSNYSVFTKIMTLLQKFYKYVFKILVKKLAKIMTRAKKEDVVKNVGETKFKPLLFNIDEYEFKKNKLTLAQIDSRLSHAIDIIQKLNSLAKSNPNYRAVRKLINTYIYDLPVQDIYQIIKESKYTVDLKLIKDYLDVISYSSKQSYNSKIWHTLLDDTLIFLINNNFDKIVNEILSHNKVLIVSKSRKAVQHLYKKLLKANIQGINITANDSAQDRFNKIKEFEIYRKNKFLISTYPIIEAGVNLPFVDLILLMDLPYRPHSLEQVINRTQRLSNLHDTINVRFFKLSYKYNILEHHYLILKEVSKRVSKVLSYLEKEF